MKDDHAIDRAHVFRPYTAVDTHAREDSLVVVSAEGPWLLDADGRRFFDASGAWWCNHLGYQHPRLVEALRRQAGALTHAPLAGITPEPAARLAEELVALAPAGLHRVFFSDNGSTAVEVAAKLAFQFHQQNGRKSRKGHAAEQGIVVNTYGSTIAHRRRGGWP